MCMHICVGIRLCVGTRAHACMCMKAQMCACVCVRVHTDLCTHAHVPHACTRSHGKRRAGLSMCSLGCEGQPDAHQGWDRRGPGGDRLGRDQWAGQSPEEPKAGPQSGRAGPV